MQTSSPALLLRIARLLDSSDLETVNHVLLTAALSPEARRLAPLVLVADRDHAWHFAQTFAGSALADRARVVSTLREIAHHDCAEEPCRFCADAGPSIGRFARALARVDDPFFRALGEVLLDEVVCEMETGRPTAIEVVPHVASSSVG
jgi:hypothetical protein